MDETQSLSNPNNYKIFIQQKFNRVRKTKNKYLSSDLLFVESENEALQFEKFSDAENFLSSFLSQKHINPRPRIIIKYKINKEDVMQNETS